MGRGEVTTRLTSPRSRLFRLSLHLFLGEVITASFVAGALVVIAGVALAQRMAGQFTPTPLMFRGLGR